MPPPSRPDGERELERAYRSLERHIPPVGARILRQLRHPRHRWLRIGAAVLLIVGGLLSFLPVLGIELLPLGLLLLSEDVPAFRRPMARLLRAFLYGLLKLRRRMQGRHWPRSRPR